MRNISLAGLLFAAILAAAVQGQTASTSSTYVVGTCRPNLTSFASITAALAAVPAPSVVDVCPGVYNEQLAITQPVTLQGVTNGDSGEVVVAVPSGGLVQNATSLTGTWIFAQLAVNNVSGSVNVSDITFDATNGTTSVGDLAGIYYQNSGGAINRVTTQHQTGGVGLGIWIEGGPSNPSVTVENSAIHDFGDVGIQADAAGVGNTVTATLKSNSVNTGYTGIYLGSQSNTFSTGNVTVNGNLIVGDYFGIDIEPGVTGSVSSNTILNSEGAGALMVADGVSVTGNKIFGSDTGILVSTSTASAQNNTITQSQAGIEFNCLSNPNVHSNTIMNVVTGIDKVPGNVTISNTYFSAGTIRNSTYCAGAR